MHALNPPRSAAVPVPLHALQHCHSWQLAAAACAAISLVEGEEEEEEEEEEERGGTYPGMPRGGVRSLRP